MFRYDHIKRVFFLKDYLPRTGDYLSNCYRKGIKEENKNIGFETNNFIKSKVIEEIGGVDFFIRIPSSSEISSCNPKGNIHTILSSLAQQKHIRYIPDSLFFNRNISKQHTLPTRDERAQNINEALGFRPNGINDGSRILLVDDILTTGSTMNEAENTIKTILPNVVLNRFAFVRTVHANEFDCFIFEPEAFISAEDELQPARLLVNLLSFRQEKSIFSQKSCARLLNEFNNLGLDHHVFEALIKDEQAFYKYFQKNNINFPVIIGRTTFSCTKAKQMGIPFVFSNIEGCLPLSDSDIDNNQKYSIFNINNPHDILVLSSGNIPRKKFGDND